MSLSCALVSSLMGPEALLAAGATAWNSSLFIAQTQPKKTAASDLRLPARNRSAPANGGRVADEGESSAAVAEKSPGFVRSMTRAIRQHAVWIVVGLVCAIAGVVIWLLMGRGSGALEDEFEELGPSTAAAASSARYSTTKIQAREVNDRLEVDATEVETDREYALVVDEDALKKPEPGERPGQGYADSAEIEGFINALKFEEAYILYVERIEADGNVQFQSQIEKALSEHFMATRDFDRAGRVLEHHVATHPGYDVAPETYFNLGYVHFFNRRLNKSRRFLKLYVEREKDPARTERARRILEALEQSAAT